eukprot:tig00020684_g12855.t1
MRNPSPAPYLPPPPQGTSSRYGAAAGAQPPLISPGAAGAAVSLSAPHWAGREGWAESSTRPVVNRRPSEDGSMHGINTGPSLMSGMDKAGAARTVLSERRLLVEVVAARNLLSAGGMFAGKENNGYVLLAFGEAGFKTRTRFNEDLPMWRQEFSFRVEAGSLLPDGRMHPLHVELRSQRGEAPAMEDPLLGSINIDLNAMKSNENYKSWYTLSLPPGRVRPPMSRDGDVQLSIFLLDFPKLLEDTRKDERERFATNSAKTMEVQRALEAQVVQLRRENEELRGGAVSRPVLGRGVVKKGQSSSGPADDEDERQCAQCTIS